jgi:hypothetical protein
MSEHAGDLLSALLDGELTVAEADQVEAHLRGCEACRTELDEIAGARSALRGLPRLDPPSWLETIGEPRSSRRSLQAVASVAASIVVVALAVGGVSPSRFQPEPDIAVDRHASTVAALGVATSAAGVTPSTAKQHDLSSLDAPMRRPPARLGAYRLVEAFDAGHGVHLLYRSGEFGLSVFESPGRIDWAALPSGAGTRMTVAGRDAWRWDGPPARGRVIVYEEDGLVVTVVADEPGDAALAIAELLPEPRDLSVAQRVERALTGAVKALSPG